MRDCLWYPMPLASPPGKFNSAHGMLLVLIHSSTPPTCPQPPYRTPYPPTHLSSPEIPAFLPSSQLKRCPCVVLVSGRSPNSHSVLETEHSLFSIQTCLSMAKLPL